MKFLSFIGTLIVAMALTSIFFTILSYALSIGTFLLFIMPMMAFMIGGYKLFKIIRR